MRKFLAATILMAAVLACGPQQPLDSSDPQLDASDEIGEQANYARKHMSDRGISSEQIGDKLATADDKAGEQANWARKHLSDRGISSEQLKDLGVMTAEDAREYLYQRGICNMRHGDDCNGEGPQEPVVIAGKDGADGKDGQDGEKGDRGPAGNDGADGRDGVDGARGPQGVQGDTGATGEQGETGAPGPAGEKGDQGDAGPKGDQGDIGPAGQSCSLENEFQYSIGHGHGRKCYYDFFVVCSNGSVKILDDERDDCSLNEDD